MRVKYLSITTLIFIVSSLLLFSQTAEEIIKKNLEARGGKNLNSIGAVQFIGKIETAGKTFKLLYIKKLPDKIRFQVDMNGTPGVTVFVADSGWIFDPSQGQYEPTKLSPEEVKLKKPLINYLMVFFDDLLLNYKSKSYNVSYVGKEKIDGKEAYKILVMLKDGTVVTYYIDTKTYLDYHHKVLFSDLNVIFDIELSDFTIFDGINIPLVIESKVKNQSMTKVTIETIKINPKLNEKYFEMPKF